MTDYPSTAELLRIYNENNPDHPIKKFRDRSTAIRRTSQYLNNQQETQTMTSDHTIKTTGSDKPKRHSNKRKFPDHYVLTSINVPNPKRKGKKTWPKFEDYRVGQTVGEHLKRRLLSNRDFIWDTNHGYITVEPPQNS